MYSIYQLDDHDDAAAKDFVAALRRADNILEAQWDKNPGSRLMLNAMKTLRKVITFVSDVNLHESRCTLPVTNSKSSNTMIEYLYST